MTKEEVDAIVAAIRAVVRVVNGPPYAQIAADTARRELEAHLTNTSPKGSERASP